MGGYATTKMGIPPRPDVLTSENLLTLPSPSLRGEAEAIFALSTRIDCFARVPILQLNRRQNGWLRNDEDGDSSPSRCVNERESSDSSLPVVARRSRSNLCSIDEDRLLRTGTHSPIEP